MAREGTRSATGNAKPRVFQTVDTGPTFKRTKPAGTKTKATKTSKPSGVTKAKVAAKKTAAKTKASERKAATSAKTSTKKV